MATLREQAMAYVPQQTKNIAELEQVPIDIDIVHATYQDKEGKDFEVNEVTIDGEKYRVPNTVISQLKTQLEERPDAQAFKVKKSGEGLKTQYTVILL